MNSMEKMSDESADIVQENIEKLKELFPEAVTENGVDFDTLRQLLDEAKTLDESEEKFGLNWRGKRKTIDIAKTPSLGTLRPCPDESVDWDKTKNIFIEGDNLEVLKILQRSYPRKIKMIYIDPPYNTGKEFIYPDKFQDNLSTYLKYTGQIDDEGIKFSSNTETGGRKHTNWLNMMYPRLKLAKYLMRDDGVIFISIDDNEQSNLVKICNEIFGENNFIGIFVINTTPNARDYGHIGKMHQYALMYVKNSMEAKTYQLHEPDKKFKYKDENSEFNIHPLYNSNVAFNKSTSPNLYYPFYVNPNSRSDGFYDISIENRNGWVEVYPSKSVKEQVQFVWRWGKEKSSKNLNTEIIGYKTNNGEFRIIQKMRHTSKIIRSLLTDNKYSTRTGTAEVEKLFGKKIFPFPKAIALIKDFVSAATVEDDIILDFFAGSGTTAHATMELNAEDGGHRKCISVQLPEEIDEETEAFKAGYKNIAEISKERIRLAGKEIKDKNPNYKGDLGFKVFKLASSNIKVWDTSPKDIKASLDEHADHLVTNRTEQDILYELLLKRGIDITIKIENRKIENKDIYSIGDGKIITCLDKAITKDDIENLAQAIIDWQKEIKQRLEEAILETHIFFRDSAFNDDDVVKSNMVAILSQNGINHVYCM